MKQMPDSSACLLVLLFLLSIVIYRQLIERSNRMSTIFKVGFEVIGLITLLFGWLLILFALSMVIDYLVPLYPHSLKSNMSTYALIANLGLIFAYLILLFHYLRWSDVMYQYRPMELKFPLEKAVINLLVAGVSAYLLTRCTPEQAATRALPPVGVILALALVGLLGSLFFSYVERTSHCCENPWAAFGGFPFSWLYGIARSDEAFQNMSGLTAGEYRLRFAEQIDWHIRFWKLGADFLFWFHVALIVNISTLSLIHRKQVDR